MFHFNIFPLRRQILLFGWVTLLIFPVPGYLLSFYFDEVALLEFFELDKIGIIPIGYGIMFGFVYAFIATLFMSAPFFETVPSRMDRIVRQMNLRLLDGIFISICAGVGEEFLFRAGIQPYLGPSITAVLFVALHGYLSPLNWRFSMYGLIVLPFIFVIAYGYEVFGIWFCIAAHFAYDAVLFEALRGESETN